MTSERELPNSATWETSDERRRFLKGALLAGGGALASPHLIGAASAQTQPNGAAPQERRNHYFVPATDKTVHWGYFSKSLKPLIELDSADYVTVEVLTHHAYDDYERMIKGDPGAESVFYWTKDKKERQPARAGPMDASIHGRGAGEAFGVHVCTGPVAVRGAEPGDILEVRIIDVKPRGCFNPAYKGEAFGSNAAAWWGFQYHDLLTDPKPHAAETQDEWVVHGFSFPNYLAQLGEKAQSEIYTKSSVDLAMRDAFRKMRHFLMTTKGLSEDEAISLMSVAVDFGVTQVVDGNWGVHAIIKKSIFAGNDTV